MHSERNDSSNSSIFHLAMEEGCDPVQEIRSTLQPFRFLFQSPLYGTIQVVFALVNLPEKGTLFHFSAGVVHHAYPKPLGKTFMCESTFKRGFLKSNLACQSFFFRIDQSLPGYCFHFESKYVVGWGPGHLGSLVQKCVLRATKELQKDDQAPYKPYLEDILIKPR